ncbi:Uncharacterised protein [Enterobacter cloacae]|nr:Uncharacterised protein [Enterobacter cloacae]
MILQAKLVVRPQRLFQIAGLRNPRTPVFKNALFDHLLVAAVEIDQIRDGAGEQHHVQHVGVAGRRQVDDLNVDIVSLACQRLLDSLNMRDIFAVGGQQIFFHNPDSDRLGPGGLA